MNDTATLPLTIAATREEMGSKAAADIATSIRAQLARKQQLRIIFAAAPSQGEMLAALAAEPGIDWTRITAFHMDEYIGLAPDAPQRFGNWLRRSFFDRVPLAAYHLIEPGNDPAAACRGYAEKLAQGSIDLVLLGIGVNAHIAFNDPPADLHDPLAVKVVSLDDDCRQQQVDDDCFASFADVPRQAITLTIPTLLRGEDLFCCVPGASKAAAVLAMLTAPVSGEVPATALRLHPRCRVYLDQDSSALLHERSLLPQ